MLARRHRRLRSYTVSGQTAGVWSYRVRAVDDAGNMSPYSNAASVVVQATDTQAPAAPTSLTATAASSSQINLAWTASTDNVGVSGLSDRTMSRLEAAPRFTQVGTTSGPSYVDTGLAASTAYSYRVRAVDGASNVSGPSTGVSATTFAGAAAATITLVQHTGKDAGTTMSSAQAFPAGQQRGQLDWGSDPRGAVGSDIHGHRHPRQHLSQGGAAE